MGRGCRILVVEDDPASRNALAMILRHLGHTVCAAATVHEAHAQLDGQSHLILDLRLPDGTGAELLARIRAEGRPIRVAVVTAEQQSPSFNQAAMLKPDAIYPKPLNLGLLLDWIERTRR